MERDSIVWGGGTGTDDRHLLKKEKVRGDIGTVKASYLHVSDRNMK